MYTTWCSVNTRDGSGWRCVPETKEILDTMLAEQALENFENYTSIFVLLETINDQIVKQDFMQIQSWTLSTPETREAWREHLRYCEEEDENHEDDDEKWKKGGVK